MEDVRRHLPHLVLDRSRASRVKQIGRDVDADDGRARLRCGNGEVAVSAGDIQHPQIRLELSAIDKVIGHLFGDPGDLRVVACCPGRLDTSFQSLDVGSLLGGHGSALRRLLAALLAGVRANDRWRLAVDGPLRQSEARPGYPFCAHNSAIRDQSGLRDADCGGIVVGERLTHARSNASASPEEGDRSSPG